VGTTTLAVVPAGLERWPLARPLRGSQGESLVTWSRCSDPEALGRFALTRWPGRSCREPGHRGSVIGESQRLSDAEQLDILALLEASSTDDSAMRAARALAELMRHLHVLGQRIAGELPDQDRNPHTRRVAVTTSSQPIDGGDVGGTAGWPGLRLP
jgi:hypothetical protein